MRIDHVALWCEDLDRMAGFYVHHFGASEGPRYRNPAKGFESVFLSFPSGARLELMRSAVLEPLRLAPGLERMGLAHLALSAGDDLQVDALTAQLREAGHVVIEGPRRTGDGYYESVVLDPEGNRVEITGMDVDRLAAGFTAATLPREEWTHQAHLAVGMWHVDRFGPEEALSRLRAGIRRLNEAHGNQNTPTAGYHETITCAYVELLSRFAASCPAQPLSERVALVLRSPIADREVLFRFYSRERLMSVEARATSVEPDLGPIGLSWI